MDFISLSCPSCGGPLQVGKDVATFVCPYCGQKHMVREATGAALIEAHGRCPVCQRNDRTRKLSAIMATGGTNSQYFAPPPRPNPPTPQPPPPRPIEPVGLKDQSGWLIYGGAALALIMFIALVSNTDRGSTALLIILLLGSIGAVVLGISQKNKNKLTHAQLQNEYQEKTRRWNESVNQAKYDSEETQRRWDARWLQAMDVWKKLYYCERDDCVFLPGGKTSAPLSNIVKYVYAESNPPTGSQSIS